MVVVVGILICIAGVAINGIAGMKRERAQQAQANAGAPKNMFLGVFVCILAGVLSSGRNVFLATLMAIGHYACLFFYGLGGFKLGALGTSVGFAMFQSGSLLVAAALGFMTGEWKQADSQSKQWLSIVTLNE